ncbi:curli production assembly protein CsgF [Portibacter lacus]|uniref:Curli production assembly/transport component CsgF n=2 Tax=Portibacter lacus TaxID=1099794 RepID=A0AA37SRV6_9BACT|nr:curli production assembly protein CsgF [Portibacter lacus]
MVFKINKMKIKNAITVLGIVLFTTSLMFGQDLVYTPKNPAFGGNYLNYSWLLNSANAQNTYEEPESDLEDLLADFEGDFNQQFLSELRRELLRSSEIFGENGLEVGTFEVGNLVVDIVPGVNGLIVTINDIITGSQTQITVPYD